MSEKLFTIEESENQLIIFDNGVSDETYFHLGNDERDVKYVCDLLNKQQADLNYLAKFIGEFKVEKFKLKLRNLRILEDKVLEQQNIISKLESDLQKIPPKIREVWIGED